MMGSQEATGLESFHLAFACPFKYLPHFEDPLSQVGMEAVGCQQLPATESTEKAFCITEAQGLSLWGVWVGWNLGEFHKALSLSQLIAHPPGAST